MSLHFSHFLFTFKNNIAKRKIFGNTVIKHEIKVKLIHNGHGKQEDFFFVFVWNLKVF